jgi:hypothetical protein
MKYVAWVAPSFGNACLDELDALLEQVGVVPAAAYTR